MRKVLIGTPAYDGKVDVWYANSLVNTIRMSYEKDVVIVPVYMAYDSLVQRARNDLVKLAIEEDFDDLIFIDADQEWDPAWIFKLLDSNKDVIAGTVVKKSDQPAFNVKALKDGVKLDGELAEVDCVGTGFMRISKNALKQVWDASEEYTNEGKTCRMVFDIKVIDGELVSEDNVFCRKWHDLGGKVYIDPSMTCNHVGIKKYTGNFMEYIKAIGALK